MKLESDAKTRSEESGIPATRLQNVRSFPISDHLATSAKGLGNERTTLSRGMPWSPRSPAGCRCCLKQDSCLIIASRRHFAWPPFHCSLPSWFAFIDMVSCLLCHNP